MNTSKKARPDHPIHDLIAQRYSPYLYDGRAVEREKLLSCLEAGRWAASSYNEQPWSLLVAERDDEPAFQKMLDCLLEANQAWARHAGVLLLTVTKRTFDKNGKPNRVAEHDIGLMAGNLTLQAEALGLSVHQMAGVNLSKVRQTYGVPETHDPLTAIAIGYAADPSQSDDAAMAERDQAERSRRPLAEWVFHGAWQQSLDGLK